MGDERGRERYRRRSRSRSRSRSRERYAGSGRRRDRDRRGHREREDHHYRRERGPRGSPVGADREEEDRDREARTVIASNLSAGCGDRELFDFFSDAGTVVDIRVIRDRRTRRCKGVAYIEFEGKGAASASLLLAGRTLLGSEVAVRSSEAPEPEPKPAVVPVVTPPTWEPKPAVAPVVAPPTWEPPPPPSAAIGLGPGPLKLYVAGLHPHITQEDLRSIFEPFGAIELVRVQTDRETGVRLGYGFVHFAKGLEGKAAMDQLDGLEVAGSRIKVQLAKSNSAAAAASATTSSAAAALPASEDAVSWDDVKGDGGVRLDARARAALMAKLSGGSQAAAVGAPLTSALAPAPPPPPPSGRGETLIFEQGLLGPASPIPTTCVLLKNLFDPAEETQEGWDEDIAEDVRQECESKFGGVSHVHVDRQSKGFAYLKFRDAGAAALAQKALDSRWFAGRKISCEFQFAQVYDKHFGL